MTNLTFLHLTLHFYSSKVFQVKVDYEHDRTNCNYNAKHVWKQLVSKLKSFLLLVRLTRYGMVENSEKDRQQLSY